jgi:hypothetical protein
MVKFRTLVACSFALVARLPQVPERVHPSAVREDLEVDVRAGRSASRPDERDRLPAIDALPLHDEEL